MKRYIKEGKIKNCNQIVIQKDGKNTYNPTEEMVIADGWEEYVVPKPTDEEKLKQSIEISIDSEKSFLEASDYKIIKCMEAYLCGETLPYDITTLHAERNAARDRINELETQHG